MFAYSTIKVKEEKTDFFAKLFFFSVYEGLPLTGKKKTKAFP